MEPSISLVRPDVAFKDEYLSFYQEWVDSGEDMVPWVIRKDPTDFEAMVRFLLENENGDNLPEAWVPSSTYWLTVDNIVVGAVNIRHRLTEKLLHSGGHIGYGIRPRERRKGYAAHLLALALQEARVLGIDKVLVVCDEGNIASAKTILKNGGNPETDFVEEDGNVIKRFWIHS